MFHPACVSWVSCEPAYRDQETVMVVAAPAADWRPPAAAGRLLKTA
jgi:hypothetical protein